MVPQVHGFSRSLGQRLAFTLMAGFVVLAAGCCGVAPESGVPGVRVPPADPLAERWGIAITALRLSANGYMVDFRYKVLDPEKAAALSTPDVEPHLIEQATGLTLAVPRTPKVGALRQTAQKPQAGRVYFMLFGNGARRVREGSRVTIAIGDFRAKDLVVQ